MNSKQYRYITTFLSAFKDFANVDYEKDCSNVYRPAWHLRQQLQFWFNPPFGDKEESEPTPSGTLLLKNDGKIYVEDFNDGTFYLLDECLDSSVDNFIYAIEVYYQEENS